VYSTKCIEVECDEFDTSKKRDFEHVLQLEIDPFHRISLLSRAVCSVCVCVLSSTVCLRIERDYVHPVEVGDEFLSLYICFLYTS